MKSKYAHFGPILITLLRTFLRFFMKILVIIRDYHPTPTPHTRTRGGTLGRVVEYDKEALEKAYAWMAASDSEGEAEYLFFPPTITDYFLPRKCLGFSVVTPSVLFLVWFPQMSCF